MTKHLLRTIGQASILYTALIVLLVISVIKEALLAAWSEIRHWLPEFATTWTFIVNIYQSGDPA